MLLMLASCTFEPEQAPVEEVLRKIVHATIEGQTVATETKVYADYQMMVLWNAGDRISLFDHTTYNHPYEFQGDDGDTAGDFYDMTVSGIHTGNNVPYYYAVYPYIETNKLSNQGVFTVNLPAEQAYLANSFGIGANTMTAVSSDGFLAFKNVCGYLSLRLYGDDITVSRVTLQANSSNVKIAGKATVSQSLGGVPSVTVDASGTNAISMVCDPPVLIGGDAEHYTSFWFVIPPVTFQGGFTITVTDTEGGVFTKAANFDYTVVRNQLDWMNALKVSPDYGDVAIVFDDDDFAAYCLQHFDTDHNGIITRSEAEAVTAIDVCTDDISSLGGIEYFTNLVTLYCRGSEITTRSSDATYAGQLESLNIGRCINLEELDCTGNQIGTLDVSNNPELDVLICTGNPLDGGIHFAPDQIIGTLECPVNAQIVYEWGDVFVPSYFPDENFSAYLFDNFDLDHNGYLSESECNDVTAIEVYTENIASLKGIEVFKNLQSLNCGGPFWNYYGFGLLTSLDLRGNPALTSVYCSGNQLTSIDISHNPALTELSCDYNQLESLDVSYNPALVSLACSFNFNNLTALDVSNNHALTELGCSYNHLATLDLSNNPVLTQLYCDGNQLTSLIISPDADLTGLYCYNNQLTSLDVSHYSNLVELLCDSNQLTSLDVSHNPALTRLLCSNATMQYLYLATGQVIPNLSKHDNTTVVYINVPLPEAVDLGLTSGIKWASFNLGAASPEEGGDYYAWGETNPYYSCFDPLTWKSGKENGYAWSSYFDNPSGDGFTFTKYATDKKITLDPEDDAANANLGINWRMPTDDDWAELLSECSWTYINCGYLVTGQNGNNIFLPQAGSGGGTSITTNGVGYYYSSSLSETNSSKASTLYFYSSMLTRIDLERRAGVSVRPVFD